MVKSFSAHLRCALKHMGEGQRLSVSLYFTAVAGALTVLALNLSFSVS